MLTSVVYTVNRNLLQIQCVLQLNAVVREARLQTNSYLL